MYKLHLPGLSGGQGVRLRVSTANHTIGSLGNQPPFRANQGFPDVLVVKNPPVNKRDASSIPGLGRSPEEGNGNPLQYSCQDNPRDRGAWWAAVHGITKSWLDMTEQLNHQKGFKE